MQKTGDPLIVTLYASLAQLLVKRRWTSLDALKSVPTNIYVCLIYRLITAYLLLRVNLDKIMHAR